jgi:hypothetical protein
MVQPSGSSLHRSPSRDCMHMRVHTGSLRPVPHSPPGARYNPGVVLRATATALPIAQTLKYGWRMANDRTNLVLVGGRRLASIHNGRHYRCNDLSSHDAQFNSTRSGRSSLLQEVRVIIPKQRSIQPVERLISTRLL